MQVTKTRFEDAGERDADGLYDYYYAGVIYRFEFATRALIARSYEDAVDEVDFLGEESLPRSKRSHFTEIPYRDPEFREAVEMLCTSEGVRCVRVLVSEGYREVDFGELAG